MPSRAISGLNQAETRLTAKRPPLTWSIPMASFASTPGWNSSGLTAAMISIRSVASAIAAAAVHVSSTSRCSLCGLTMCSASRTESKPACSTSRSSARVRA